MTERFITAAMLVFAAFFCAAAAAVPNPVLEGAADCGVFQFNGRYYLMGMGTGGGMFFSDDLIRWEGPVHAFSMDNDWAAGAAGADSEIHACDISLINGEFNLFWSVNHGELRQIGRAVSDTVLGPYREPVRSRPFDGRIDPQLFRDTDGRLYFYTTKFDPGNVVWGQAMKDAATLSGEPQPLLFPVPGTWELQDYPVNEGPFAVRYRGLCYMLYNANHTSLEYGNYAVGCAVAEGPLEFNATGKYPHPVLDDGVPPTLAANCGQPNLVRGPNGFEWWLAYFAVYDGKPKRSQGVDRVHFLGPELYVDGPTTARTPGYHPSPAMPVFRDNFDLDGALAGPWRTNGGTWCVSGGGVRQSEGQRLCMANLDAPEARNYLFSSGLRFEGPEGRQIGIIAWENGREHALYVGLDRREKNWFWVSRKEFVIHTEVFPLPDGFNWEGWHSLGVEKNGARVKVLLDGIPAPGKPVITLADDRPGHPGIVTRNSAALFDGVMYSIGWDEWDGGIQGWGAAADGTPASGVWGDTKEGLAAEFPEGEARAFKGDPLEGYEFSVLVTPEGGRGGAESGCYAVYADNANWLRVALDAALTKVRVTGMCAGAETPPVEAPLKVREHRIGNVNDTGCALRVVRRADGVVVFADGLEVTTVPGRWPASQPGLFTSGVPCRFNYITHFWRDPDGDGAGKK